MNPVACLPTRLRFSSGDSRTCYRGIDAWSALAGLSTRVSPYHIATKFQLLGTIGLTEACQVGF